MSAIPQGATRDEWLQALPRALVAGFVKTDIEFQQKGVSKLIVFLKTHLLSYEHLLTAIICCFLQGKLLERR